MTRVLKPYRTVRPPRAERAPSAQGMSETATSTRPAITSGHHRRDCCGSATIPGFWTPAKALAAARAKAAEENRVVKACSLEVSCRFEKQYLDDDLSRYDDVMRVFYNYMHQNRDDVAFINAHNVRSFDPDWAVGKVSSDADLRHWRTYVSTFKALHGPPA